MFDMKNKEIEVIELFVTILPAGNAFKIPFINLTR